MYRRHFSDNPSSRLPRSKRSSHGRSKLLCRNCREHSLHTGLCISNRDFPEDREEQEHRGLQVAAVRDHPSMHLPLDLLRPPQARRPPHRHRQRRRRRAGGHLRRALPRVRPQGDQGEDGEAGAGRERRRPCCGRRGGAGGVARRRPAVRGGLALRRADDRDVCSANGRHEDCGEDQERGVHALLPLLLPLPQRRRLERLRHACQGLLHRNPERRRVRAGHGAAGAVPGVPEEEGGAQGRRGGRGGAPDGAGGDVAEAGAAAQGAEPAHAVVAVGAAPRVREHRQGLLHHPRGAALHPAPARALRVRERQGRRRGERPRILLLVKVIRLMVYVCV